jgi:tetratricopeptide (TPR) repeat protein
VIRLLHWYARMALNAWEALGAWVLAWSVIAVAQTSDPVALSREAKGALASGDFNRAIGLYGELCRQLPSEPGLRLNLGIALYSGGRASDAVVELERALRQDPSITPAYLFLGLARMRAGRHAAAVAPLSRAILAEPGNAVALLALGDAHLGAGDLRAAAEAFTRASKVQPENPKAWRGLGLSYSGISRAAFAKLPPESAAAMVLLARSRLAQNEPKAAFGLLQRAAKLDPGLPGVHAGMAEVHRLTGHPEWADAADARESAIKRKPEGSYAEALEASARALEALERLTGLPESPEMHEAVAEAARLRGAFKESAEALRRAVALRPGDSRLVEELARSLWLDRNYEEAMPLLKKHGMEFELGYALLESGRPAEAIPLLARGSRNPRLAIEAAAALGRAYLESGEPAKAIEPLSRGLAADRDGSVHFQLSRAYQRTGQAELARQLQERSNRLRREDDARRESVRSMQITPQ